MYDKTVFARNLVRLMKASGETQADIARLLNVSKSTVSAYCKASQLPRMDKIEILAKHFSVQKSDLIEEPSANAITPAERVLLDKINALPPEKRAAILALLD
ncbi:MAG: helix-turn-helix transcriptional regulator [Oscillospiraceae bacterium]|nr:helix-turn-helix transcriptional regulator [Oscillospiraceae bacterium]